MLEIQSTQTLSHIHTPHHKHTNSHSFPHTHTPTYTPTHTVCPTGVPLVQCEGDPCAGAVCPSHPLAECRGNFCGGVYSGVVWGSNTCAVQRWEHPLQL